MSQKFFNLVKTQIFYEFWLCQEHDRANGRMELVTSFQAIASVAPVALSCFLCGTKQGLVFR